MKKQSAHSRETYRLIGSIDMRHARAFPQMALLLSFLKVTIYGIRSNSGMNFYGSPSARFP